MDSTDKTLIDAHCQGDPTAFAELVRRYCDSVLGYLMRMTGSLELAEELFQETFKRVHEKAHMLRGNRFKPWLFSIATRVAIDSLRRRKRRTVVSLNHRPGCADGRCEGRGVLAVADNSSEPSQQAIKAEQKRQVLLALESLPARQKATLVLVYYQQLSYQQVADVMGCSVGTVKTQMYRALKTLSQKLPDIPE